MDKKKTLIPYSLYKEEDVPFSGWFLSLKNHQERRRGGRRGVVGQEASRVVAWSLNAVPYLL